MPAVELPAVLFAPPAPAVGVESHGRRPCALRLRKWDKKSVVIATHVFRRHGTANESAAALHEVRCASHAPQSPCAILAVARKATMFEPYEPCAPWIAARTSRTKGPSFLDEATGECVES